MKKQTLVLLVFIALKFILQYLVIAQGYDLHRDEYLHLDQANHLAWGYLSVPPFTSWISLLIKILGNGVFWVRFFPALFGALTMLIVWKTTDALGGKLFAKTLAATAFLFSAYVRINMLFQPNSADAFFWTLLFFTLIRYFQTDSTKWLWYAATAFAFGLLNKYNIAFLAIGLTAAFLVTQQRKIFAEKKLYFAILLAFLIILPNLIWQWQNGFPVVHHMKELSETQLENVNRMDFVKEQILFFIGSIFVLLGGLLALAVIPAFKKYRFVFWAFAFTLAVFIYLKAKGYYAIGLYPILLPFGGIYWEMKLLKKPILRLAFIALPIVMFIPILKLAFPIAPPQQIADNSQRMKKFGLLRWEDGKDHALPQDFADMIGWREMALIVDKAYASIPNASENTLVLCDNYGQAGAIHYYSRFKNLHAVSFNADYLFWMPTNKRIFNVIAVKDLTDDDPKRIRERPLFQSIELAGQIANPLAREYGTKIYIYKSAEADINKRIEAEAEAKKSAWTK
ncbi:MAG: glycosyltransferase family 39 protein [Flavobacterium sp.]|nr:MAG: glycosyltransferase family 39 protein [Flavobacterium sp.]